MYLEVIAVIHYNNHDGVSHACVLTACISSKYSKCISDIKRILSTTAMYTSSSSFMYMCISLYCDACLKSSALRVGVKTLRDAIARHTFGLHSMRDGCQSYQIAVTLCLKLHLFLCLVKNWCIRRFEAGSTPRLFSKHRRQPRTASGMRCVRNCNRCKSESNPLAGGFYVANAFSYREKISHSGTGSYCDYYRNCAQVGAFPACRTFCLVTDQRSLALMLYPLKGTKIKNNRILLWRAKLSTFSYRVEQTAGIENVIPDALSRPSGVAVAISGDDSLKSIHDYLGHPGVRRLKHLVKPKNLPFSHDEVKGTCRECKICAELKPLFYKQAGETLKATCPWERIAAELKVKGKLPYVGYLLSSSSVVSHLHFCAVMFQHIQCLTQLFCLFGMPGCVYSDRGSAFMSSELREFLLSRNVAASRRTPYQPEGTLSASVLIRLCGKQ